MLFEFPLLSVLFTSALCEAYSQTAEIIGPRFYDAFNFIPGPDANNGRVHYVDEATARQQNITFASSDSFVLRVDARQVSRSTRASANIRTKRMYTTHVEVLDIRKMPIGCGTWPAIWQADVNIWPAGGEIDLLEGVNDIAPNKITFHAMPPCAMPHGLPHTGTSEYSDCNVLAPGNVGCGVKLNDRANYGPAFNANGGGWYALERTLDFYKVWFWPRDSPSVPSVVRYGASMIDTSAWGTPAAFFPSSSSCNLREKLAPHNIIITLSLCGNWAGIPSIWAEYCAPGRSSNCYDWVDNNPSALSDAYFDIASLRFYE